jgi:hypothetical protein
MVERKKKKVTKIEQDENPDIEFFVLSEDPSEDLGPLDLSEVTSGDVFDELTYIINRHDPMRLISFGFPESEYYSEVDAMLAQLDIVKNEAETLSMVYDVFCKWFGSAAGKKKDYKKLAKDIYFWKVQKESSSSD